MTLSLLLAMTVLGSDSPIASAAVGDQSHFRATFDAPSASVVQIIQQAQSSDLSVRVQTGSDVTNFKESQPCPSCDPANESAFFQRPQLVADGQIFWMRLANDNWEHNLRPTPESAGTYALIVSPRLPSTELNDALAPFGVLPCSPSSFDFSAYRQPSDPQPPQGVVMTPELYGLLHATEWAEAAAERGVTRSGLRAVVEVELSSSLSELPSGLDLAVESRSVDTALVQVLIPDLDDLAESSNVREVRSISSS